MTTSSENTTPSKSRPSGDHWFEMSATLNQHETQQFGDWIDDALETLEMSLFEFSSPDSRGETICRR